MKLIRILIHILLIVIFIIMMNLLFSRNHEPLTIHRREHAMIGQNSNADKLLLSIKNSIGLHKWCRNHQTNNMTYGRYVDKHWVKQYIKSATPDLKFSKEYTFVSTFEEISNNLLQRMPPSYVVKPSHFCGEIIIVKDGTPESHMVRGPSKLCKTTNLVTCLRESCKFWLARAYSDVFGEKYYKNTPRKCIFEEYLDTRGIRPIDIKAFTFHGKPYIIDVREHIKNTEPVMQDYFTPSWKRLNLTRVPDQERAPRNYARKKPEFLEKFLKFSEIIGQPFPFMRIDFFWYGNHLSFAEFSPTPHGCGGRFGPALLEQFYGFIVSNPEIPIHPDYALTFV